MDYDENRVDDAVLALMCLTIQLFNYRWSYGAVNGLVLTRREVRLILSEAPYSVEFFQEDQADLSSRNRSERAAGLQGLLVLKGLFPAREVDAQ